MQCLSLLAGSCPGNGQVVLLTKTCQTSKLHLESCVGELMQLQTAVRRCGMENLHGYR